MVVANAKEFDLLTEAARTLQVDIPEEVLAGLLHVSEVGEEGTTVLEEGAGESGDGAKGTTSGVSAPNNSNKRDCCSKESPLLDEIVPGGNEGGAAQEPERDSADNSTKGLRGHHSSLKEAMIRRGHSSPVSASGEAGREDCEECGGSGTSTRSSSYKRDCILEEEEEEKAKAGAPSPAVDGVTRSDREEICDEDDGSKGGGPRSVLEEKGSEEEEEEEAVGGGKRKRRGEGTEGTPEMEKGSPPPPHPPVKKPLLLRKSPSTKKGV